MSVKFYLKGFPRHDNSVRVKECIILETKGSGHVNAVFIDEELDEGTENGLGNADRHALSEFRRLCDEQRDELYALARANPGARVFPKPEPKRGTIEALELEEIKQVVSDSVDPIEVELNLVTEGAEENEND